MISSDEILIAVGDTGTSEVTGSTTLAEMMRWKAEGRKFYRMPRQKLDLVMPLPFLSMPMNRDENSNWRPRDQVTFRRVTSMPSFAYVDILDDEDRAQIRARRELAMNQFVAVTRVAVLAWANHLWLISQLIEATKVAVRAAATTLIELGGPLHEAAPCAAEDFPIEVDP